MENQKTVSKPIVASRDIAYISLFVALICVSAWISIPWGNAGISFTLQLFTVCLTGIMLGTKRGFLAVLAYVLLGMIGVPVFSGFTSGITVTTGYIVGFIFTELCIGLISDLTKKFSLKQRIFLLMLAGIIGIVICYAFGTAWFVVFMGNKGKTIMLSYALGVCVVPYIIPDLLKLSASVVVALRLAKIIKI